MPNDTPLGGALRPLAFLASLTLVVVALYFAKAVLVPVVLAVLIAFLLARPVEYLEHRRLPRILAIALVMLVTVGLFLGGLYLVGSQLRNLAQDLPQYKDNVIAKINGLSSGVKGESWVTNLSNSVRDIYDTLRKQLPGPETPPVQVQVQSFGFPLISDAAAPVVEGLLTFGFALLLVIFMLMRREDLRNRLLRLWGDTGSLTTMTKAFDEAGKRIGRYLLVQLILNSSFGVCMSVALLLANVPYAILWGLLAGALRYVPYVGVWCAAAFPVILGLATPGWVTPLVVLGLFLAFEMVWANFLEPHFLGHSIGVSEAALLICAAFWAWLWGPIGLILAVPMTACLVVLGKFIPQLEFFHTLLGVEPVLEPHLIYFQRVLARDHDEAADVAEEYLKDHDAEQAFAAVLLPAVSLAKQKSGEGQFTPDDERAVYQVTQEVIDEVPVPVPENPPGGEPVLAFGCPAGSEADELGLQMLGHLLRPTGCRFEVISAHVLSGELLARIREEGPDVLVLAAVFPQSIAHTRYLCKRLRTAFPGKKMVVGCWGYKGNMDKVRDRLKEAGADEVGTTLQETRALVEPMVRFLAVQDATPEPAGAV